jgi:prepilin-type processing-associated H-X9-DG protein
MDFACRLWIMRPSRSEIGNAFNNYLNDPVANVGEIFWGCKDCDSTLPNSTTVRKMAADGTPVQFRGIIQRADWSPVPVTPFNPTGGLVGGFATKMTMAKIIDGTSKTLLAGEKRLRPSEYAGNSTRRDARERQAPTFDDRGWADGFDHDHLRSCMFPIDQDGELPEDDGDFAFSFGSAHAGGINALFADGSVTTIGYDVDRETFNRLGHRSDGETITQSF